MTALPPAIPPISVTSVLHREEDGVLSHLSTNEYVVLTDLPEFQITNVKKDLPVDFSLETSIDIISISQKVLKDSKPLEGKALDVLNETLYESSRVNPTLPNRL
jgi:hypothetical protein